VSIPLYNGWTDTAGLLEPSVSYFVDYSGFVHLRGGVKDGTCGIGVLVGVVPTGAFRHVCLCNSSIGMVELFIEPWGAIVMPYTVTWFRLGSVIYRP
jgi:hypothetical protein